MPLEFITMYLKAEDIIIIAASPSPSNLQYGVVCITETQLWIHTHTQKMVTLRSSDSCLFWGLIWQPIPKAGGLRRCHIAKCRLPRQSLPRLSAWAGPQLSLWFQLAIASHVFPGLIPLPRGSESGKGATEQKVLGIGTSGILQDGDTF